MGSLNRAVLLLILATTSAMAADGNPPGQEPKPTAPATAGPAGTPAPAGEAKPASRPEPPAAPRKYLEAGARLFNSGRFDLSRKYLAAAHMYRDRLTASERVVLDVYREKIDSVLKSQANPAPAPTTPAATPAPESTAGTPAATVDTNIQAVSLSNSARAPLDPLKALARRPDEDATPNMAVPPGFDTPATDPATSAAAEASEAPAGGESLIPTGTVSFRGTMDSKQKARWLLQLAREQILKKHYDVAEQAIAEARTLDVKWSMFDETPERLAEALAKARGQGTGPVGGLAANLLSGVLPTGTPHDRRSARARLKEARTALAASNLDRADEIVREVRSWGVSYGLFDDTPDKVAAAIYDARRKEVMRGAELMIQSYYRDQMQKQAESGPMTGPPVLPSPPN